MCGAHPSQARQSSPYHDKHHSLLLSALVFIHWSNVTLSFYFLRLGPLSPLFFFSHYFLFIFYLLTLLVLPIPVTTLSFFLSISLKLSLVVASEYYMVDFVDMGECFDFDKVSTFAFYFLWGYH
jgi:hypothetical protein